MRKIISRILQLSIWRKYKYNRRKVIPDYLVEIGDKAVRCGLPGKEGLGYHEYACPDHGDQRRIVPHTCKTKICTTCATIRNDQWSEEVKQKLPREKYFHITFTMPEEFRSFFHRDWNEDWNHLSNLYELGWKVIRGYLKAQHNILTGGVIVLHTFGRDLKINPHLHCIVPAGGLDISKDYKEWKKLEYIAHEYMREAWKHNLLEYVISETPYLRNHTAKILKWNTSKMPEAKKKLVMLIQNFVPGGDQEMWNKVLTVDYYVNTSKRQNFSNTVSYIARYSRRLPIAKSRVLEINEEQMYAKWCYTPHNKGEEEVITTMDVFDFYDRILRHVPPKNFRMVRYYGIFASKNTKRFKDVLDEVCVYDAPEEGPSWRERLFQYTGEDPLICPCCKKDMVLIKKMVWDEKLQDLREILIKKS